jgi:DNA-directed RNA polymerase specialized sigma24 family protein
MVHSAIDTSLSESTVHYEEPEARYAFTRCYGTYSSIVYHIASQLVQDELPAEQLVSDVFVCLYRQGYLAEEKEIRLHHVLPVLFSCAEQALLSRIPAQLIQARIAAVRQGLLRRC